MPQKRTVLLALTTAHHGMYQGVARYAREHDWHLVPDMLYAATNLSRRPLELAFQREVGRTIHAEIGTQ